MMIMITYVDFSLFESPAKVLVNTVNTVGVMGKGIAKEFKRIYPEMFKEYQVICERQMFDIGDLWLYKTEHKWVLNFPTKKHWRSPSKPEYIETGLKKFVNIYQDARIGSVSIPLLGCGNGELDWNKQVKPIMERYLKTLPIQIFIHLNPAYSSTTTPEHHNPKETKKWLRSQPQSLGFTEVWDDIVAIIEKGDRFKTFDNQKSFIVTEFFKDDGGITITAGSEQFGLYKEQFLDLWQQIRDIGVCIPRIMPSGLDEYAEYVLPILSELPYLTQIRQSDKDTGLTHSAHGLLLKSPSKESDLSKPEQLQLV